MLTLCLHPAMQLESSCTPRVLAVQASQCREVPLALHVRNDGSLATTPGNHRGPLLELACVNADNSDLQWLLVRRDEHLLHNGLQAFPLNVVELGDLLACGPHSWLVTALWQPHPESAPEGIANEGCPVCGGALHLAPIVRCVCGRYTHLEKPEDLSDPQALNCYLQSGQCTCLRTPSLEPAFLPEPDESLIAPKVVAKMLGMLVGLSTNTSGCDA